MQFKMMTMINLLTGIVCASYFFPSQNDYFLNHSPSSLFSFIRTLTLQLEVAAVNLWDCLEMVAFDLEIGVKFIAFCMTSFFSLLLLARLLQRHRG